VSRHPVSRRVAAIGLLTLVAFAVRAVSLDAQSLWRDEVDALRFATAPWPDMLSNFTRPGWNGPLYFLLLRGWVGLAGTTGYGMRFFSLCFGVLCVPLAYVLGHRLFDQFVGLLTALLVAVSAYLTWYGQEVKMYTLVLALGLLAIYGQRRALDGCNRRWWAVYVIATTLAFYSHILAALLIPVHVLLYLMWWPETRRQWTGALASLASLILPYLPLAVWQGPLLFQARETGFHRYALHEMAQILLSGWSLGIRTWGRPWGSGLVAVLAAWGLASPLFLPLFLPLVRPLGKRPEKGWGVSDEGMIHRAALLCWLGAPVLIVWLVSLWQPLFTDRYMIWAVPAFYLMVALGLASFRRFGRWGRWVVALLVGIVLVLDGVNLWQQAHVPIKSDFRSAAAYVAGYHELSASQLPTHADDTRFFKCYLPLVARGGDSFPELIVFQIPYGRYTFDYYYTEGTYPWAEGLYTNYRALDGSYLVGEYEVSHHMQEATAGREVVWLVATEMAMWDERGLVQAWLDVNAQRVDEAHFAHVDVYRYVR
jgi:mannosyltransferase